MRNRYKVSRGGTSAIMTASELINYAVSMGLDDQYFFTTSRAAAFLRNFHGFTVEDASGEVTP